MALRFVILGGGPAGVRAATTAARLGAEVTLIERDIIGGAANLWDCVPSKAMISTGGELIRFRHAAGMGLDVPETHVDPEALRTRITEIVGKLESSNRRLLESQGVNLIRGTGRLIDAHTVEADSAEGIVAIEADAIMVATDSRPRIPD